MMGVWSSCVAAVWPVGRGVALALGLLAAAQAQSPAPEDSTADTAPPSEQSVPAASAPAPARSSKEPEPLLLEVGDTVGVSVVGMAELETVARVTEDGRIEAPLVGRVPVLGVSLATAAERVATAYREGEFLVDPDVRVVLAVPRPLPVQVLGEVVNPGPIRWIAPLSVAAALQQVGGLTPAADQTVVILRGAAVGRPATRIEVDLGDDPEAGAGATVMLAAGDQLEVPAAPRFRVRGAVRTPGDYPLRGGTTVAAAIQTAGGLDEQGSLRRVEILRREGSGRVEKRDATAEDLVRPDDEIHVKERWF